MVVVAAGPRLTSRLTQEFHQMPADWLGSSSRGINSHCIKGYRGAHVNPSQSYGASPAM